ncbi:PAQR family membrane homeostasis protein TrhA [Lentiprolixibacter aurantiacus]|uniref:Hemolysin III family protein n=1 Tax=Lentiprolixibacter aurantiacus TaxID=2993939 RepID=A0AAE3MKZ4_9FLAO|nr:hemolysin III family protein [Lentiprolixibacter aurantiacus]MCX2719343.1 hemolysin III family protein [Lentiprolixibacter aurantiacus]
MNYKEEEYWNTGSHGLGVLLGLIGCYLMVRETTDGQFWERFSVWVYSISIILLFAASTTYHAVADPRKKRKWRILDHISIYYLIAGTYTPVALITLGSGNGWTIFFAVWAIALGGTILKLFFTGKWEYFSLFLYLLMGWMIIFDIQNLISLTSSFGLGLLFAGGAFYTLGIFFYAFQRIPYNHLIWHFFVLGGAISHWFYIYLEVI